MTPLILFGAAGQARVVMEAVAACGTHRVIGLVSERPAAFECAVPVLGEDKDLPSIWKSFGPFEALIAIGDGSVRQDIAARCRQLFTGLAFATVIHPLARVAGSVLVEPGAFVAIGATLCAGARVGAHALVNTNASVDHDCVIGRCASIAPGVSLGGSVTVGALAFIGIGAAVLPNLHVGEGAIVGGGAAVVQDVPPHTTVVGVPARPIRKHP